MNAWIEAPGVRRLAVPEDAVVRSGSQEYVFVEKSPKQFELTPVQRVVSENGFVGISSNDTGLPNQTIIIKNAYAALMKMKNTGEEEE